MLNPATADATCNDATIKKCIRYAKSWGYGGIEVCNLFAWRAKDKSEIRRVCDPVGAGNDAAIDALFSRVPENSWRHGGTMGVTNVGHLRSQGDTLVVSIT